MIVKYVNCSGKTVNLNQLPYKMLISDILDYESDVVENDGKISGFSKKFMLQREVNIDVHRLKTKSARVSLNELTNIFESDIENGIPGRLYIDDSYMTCFFFGRETDRWETDNIISCSYKIITDTPVWITEQTVSINPITQTVDSNAKGYPYSYPYSYAQSDTATPIKIDHYAASDFQMRIYGPATSVNITIVGHVYHVDYPVEEGEYMVIDSRDFLPADQRLYLVRNNGQKINIFNYRDPVYSVFKKIPAGSITIDYNRLYGIDLTIFIERSEPKWK